MKTLYTAVATATGGRQGRIKSSDARLDLNLSMPEELGGKGGDGTNPEQLFAAGYAACFESALNTVAGRQKRSMEGSSVTAHVGVGPLAGGSFGLEVELHASLPGMTHEEAEALMAEAYKVCPYSNATQGNINVNLMVDQ